MAPLLGLSGYGGGLTSKLLFSTKILIAQYWLALLDASSSVSINDIASDNNDYYDLIVKCIDKIETKEELIECKNISAEKIEQFVDALSSSQFNQIIEFMKTIPKLEYKIDYTTTDGENRSIAMRGIKDFF